MKKEKIVFAQFVIGVAVGIGLFSLLTDMLWLALSLVPLLAVLGYGYGKKYE